MAATMIIKKELDEDDNDLNMVYYESDDDQPGDTLTKLLKDITVTNKKKGAYPCQLCNYKSNKRTDLLNHYKSHLPLYVETYRCQICKKTFETNKELVEHKQEHENDGLSFICKICKLAFTEHCDWLVHEVKHLARLLYKCRECDRHFAHKFIYEKHIYVHYNPRIPCGVCSEVFRTNADREQHLNVHSARFPCGECGRACAERSALRRHLAAHAGVRRHQCLHCGKGFFNRQQVVIHTRVHTNERPFKCQHCPRSFKQQTDMKRHACKSKSAPALEKKFQCDICKKTFLHKASIALHIKIHTNDRAFRCNQCDHACITPSALKWHIFHKHTETKVHCDVPGCDFESKYSHHIPRHKRDIHKIDV